MIIRACSIGLERDLAFQAISKNAEKCIKRSSISLISWIKIKIIKIVYRKSFKGTISFATADDIKRLEKKQEKIDKKLKQTKMMMELEESKIEEKKENAIEIEEEIIEKPKLLSFKIDV